MTSTPPAGRPRDQTAALADQGPASGEARRLRSSFQRYRLMSYAVGTMLLVMVCLGLPLQYAWGHAKLAGDGWTLHGFLYIVYLLSAGDLARRARFTFWQLVGVVTAGFLPGLAFFVEHRVAKRILGR
jgi:integral membrane protein